MLAEEFLHLRFLRRLLVFLVLLGFISMLSLKRLQLASRTFLLRSSGIMGRNFPVKLVGKSLVLVRRVVLR